MLIFCFANACLGHAASSTPVVTDSSIDGRGEWVPTYDDGTLVPRLDMVFDTVEDYLEFYKRHTVYVGFSVRSDPTRKNKVGKSWKRHVCSKEGFRRQAKKPEIIVVTGEAMPQARDGPKGGKLRQKRAEIRKGCQAHILLRSTDNGSLR